MSLELEINSGVLSIQRGATSGAQAEGSSKGTYTSRKVTQATTMQDAGVENTH